MNEITGVERAVRPTADPTVIFRGSSDSPGPPASVQLFAFVGKSGLGGGGRFFATSEGGRAERVECARGQTLLGREGASEAVSKERGKREVAGRAFFAPINPDEARGHGNERTDF